MFIRRFQIFTEVLNCLFLSGRGATKIHKDGGKKLLSDKLIAYESNMQTGEDEQYVKLSEGVVLFTGDTGLPTKMILESIQYLINNG